MRLKDYAKSIPVIYKTFAFIYQKIHNLLYYYLILKIRFLKIIASDTVFLVITPAHGNLGDHAIAKAEQLMLKKCNIHYCEITGKRMFEMMKKNQLHVFNGSCILCNGGGYLGTLWLNDEILVRNILKENPDSQIIFMPNTIFFDDTEQGKKEFIESKRVYKSHNHVKFYAREKESYELLKGMGVSVGLAPDMVMSLKEDSDVKLRSGCLLMLRSDCEKTRTEEIDIQINEFVCNMFGDNIKRIDTVVPYGIPIRKRDDELMKLYEQLHNTELVITDRLHGMILSLITGTPCIVLNSKSPKVLGSYEWIRDFNYIKICNDPSNLSQIYSEMPHVSQVYDNSKLLSSYLELITDIKSLKNN